MRGVLAEPMEWDRSAPGPAAACESVTEHPLSDSRDAHACCREPHATYYRHCLVRVNRLLNTGFSIHRFSVHRLLSKDPAATTALTARGPLASRESRPFPPSADSLTV